ncbi:alpha/beta fold hydrolase [Paenibacillus pinisoli]|uniref:Alpha/beta fold hydrolase n=1 Tax=Paenibacillus pinisoli TaxID=1276110 RepID=A0A3A6PKK3_9BACL|nr:alpha/beta fold hydrolase [Paenibacillus pinisoli]RJX39818.1 alpha/beta fold hydrolase [Paenibacillus pinisoli]
MNTVFLTGGSGFIGRQVMAQLVRAGHKVYVLSRSNSKLLETMRAIGLDEFSAITPLQGDLTKPALGLSPADQERISKVDVIIHAGGPMDIMLQADQAQKVFRDGAIEMVRLAANIHKSHSLKHFIHVVGFKSPYSEIGNNHDGLSHPHKAPPYEQMKFEADLLIRQELAKLGVPLSVVNPSVVIGDSYTGMTEQLGGLGILVNSVRRGLMAFAPGGKKYWLPLVHVDHVAACIAALAQEKHPVSDTYFLLDQQTASPDMIELTRLIAKESGVRGPIGAIPYRFIKALLNLGIDKGLKMPKESIDFIVNSEFPLASKMDLQAKHGLQLSVIPSTLPFVVADLDFRISHGSSLYLPHPFRLSRRANLATIEKEGHGPPIILLHGTFSSAYALLPLAEQLATLCENPIYLIDLPGFGRSPIRHHDVQIKGLEQSIRDLLMSIDSPVILVGHSLGGYIAAKMIDQVPEHIHMGLLLQPVLQPLSIKFKAKLMTLSLLRFASESAIKRMLLKEQSFAGEHEIPAEYIRYIHDELSSPRIRSSTAEAMSALARPESFSFSPANWDENRLTILWGTQESNFHIPDQYAGFPAIGLPYAHQFPISHPAETASRIQEALQEYVVPNHSLCI